MSLTSALLITGIVASGTSGLSITKLSKELDGIKRSIAALQEDNIPIEDIRLIYKKIEEVDKKLRSINNGDKGTGWSIFGRR